MPRSRPTASPPFCSRRSSSSDASSHRNKDDDLIHGGQRNQIDQDALAAEWGVALESEDRRAAPVAAAAGPIATPGSDEAAAQWAAMVDDGTTASSPPKGGAERILNQEEIDSLLGFSLTDVTLNDNSGIRAIINSAMVSYERLPMLEIVFDRLVRLMTTSLAQFHLRQRRSLARPHHLGALRRLSQFDSAAGDPGGVQGRGVGQFRPRHRQFQPDLFDHRRAARRPARPEHGARRGPALHHHRDQSGQAHDRGGAGGRRACLQAAVAGQVQHRPARDQSALCRDLAAGQCRDSGAAAHRHGRPRRQYRIAAALRDHRTDPRHAAADVHGREVRPRPDLGRPSRDRNRPGADRRRRRAVRGAAAAAQDDGARTSATR